MSRGFNKVILLGNLARDPDVRHTPSRQKVARITVAVNRQWKNKETGETQNKVDFIPVVAWSFLADLCERYLRKGKPVLVEGRIQVRDYDDAKTGTHKWVTEVIADNLTLLSSGRSDEDYGSMPTPTPKPQQSSYSKPAPRSQTAAPSYSNGDVGSLRDEIDFEEDFPLDFSELGDSGDGGGDVEVPF
ncbi:MAG: single-stranded DNA-binding protein [Synergistaceae bacterium]|jgi:single-strand DNA-binding protein|nr:single-stranded DNA-binding protein [Synergistaceae bacterium]